MDKLQIEEFVQSALWKAICAELEARKQMIVDMLIIGGDLNWTDDNMRGRISELEYLKSTPDAMIAEIELSNEELQKNADSDNKEE